MARNKCFFDDVKKELECSVCQEQFSEINEPKILKCLHTFCKTCLEAWIRQHREGELSCPTCRQITECPNSDINRLPSNLFYKQMLEIVEAYSGQGQEDSSQCGNCEQKASLKFYCSDCNCFLCEHCAETHKKWKSFKEHHIKGIGSFDSSDVQDYARKANVCKKHKDELRYYCDKCKICICRDCAILEHQDHNKISFEQGLEKKKSEISKRMQEVETVGILLKQQKESLQKRGTRVNNSIDQATDEAHRFAEHCITLIRNHEATIINELLNHKASFSSEFSSQMSSLDEKVKDVNSSLEFGKDILERNNLPEILNVEETLERRFQDFLSSPEFSRCIKMNNYGVKYKPRDVSNIENELGKLSFSDTEPSLSIAQGKGLTEGLQGEDCTFTIVTKDWYSETTYSESDLVNVDIQSGRTGKVTKSIITDARDGCYEVKFRPEDAGEFRVSISVGGETIKDSPFDLKIFETSVNAPSTPKEKKKPKRGLSGCAGSIKNQVGDGDGNSTADSKQAEEHVAESVNISSSETHQPTAKHEMTANESSSNKGKSPSEDVNEIGGKGKGSKVQTTGDQKSLCVTIDKSLNELASFNATTSKDGSQASGVQVDHNAESVNISSSETDQPTAKHEMTANESSSNKGKSPSEDVNEIGGKGKGSKEQTTGDQKSLRVTIDKSLDELASFNATTSKDGSRASGVQVDHNAEERQISPSKTNQVADFKTICSEMGFIVVDNEGQGNCMFIALSDQLALKGISTVSHKELRQSSVEYLRKNPKMPACGTKLSGFFQYNKRFSWSEYLEDMAKDGTWGDSMTLYAVANCYGVRIKVISSLSRVHDRIIRPGPQCAVSSNTELVVGHIDEFHYFSLRPNYGVTSKALPVVSGRSSYKPSFPAEIGGDKILGEKNVRDNKTLTSNKDSGLDEGNNQARSTAAKPVTSTFPAPRDAASTSPSLAFCEEEAYAKKLNRLPIEGGTAPVLNTASQTEDIRGGEDRALLERASEQGEETEGVHHQVRHQRKPGVRRTRKSKMASNQPVELKSKSSLILQLKEGISEWILMSPSSKAAIYWLIVIAGSFSHDFLPLPHSYFSNKRNVFNVYFVKLGWGWTLGLIIPFISLTSFAYTSRNPSAMLRHLSRLIVGTCAWYDWVNLFVYIEELTGFCEGEESLTSKRSCHLQGYHWDGFDISGHTFLLTYSALIISEEIQLKRWLPVLENEKSKGLFGRTNVLRSLLIDLFFTCASLLLVLWEFMLVCTSLYFHTVHQKVLGALVALFTWHVTYKVWYKSELSPGVPWLPRKRI